MVCTGALLLLEAIQDPLTHLVRNAVDHGIETPEVRLAAGKPAEGCLILRAFHENGEVNIVDEFVNMILAQRSYESNSRVIKAADEMLQGLNQLAQ